MSALSKKDISKTILTSYRDNEQITESDDDSRTARQSHLVVRELVEIDFISLAVRAQRRCGAHFPGIRAGQSPLFSKPSLRFEQVVVARFQKTLFALDCSVCLRRTDQWSASVTIPSSSSRHPQTWRHPHYGLSPPIVFKSHNNICRVEMSTIYLPHHNFNF